MRRILIAAAIGGIGWYAWSQSRGSALPPPVQEFVAGPEPSASPNIERTDFSCDGRKYCSQMTSCAEAEYFLKNCPGVKMDGGGDGVPCEKQWCGDR
jgi:hypothetical protein